MGQKRILSPETPVRSFPTPNIEDLVVIQDVDSRLPGYKPLDYGTPHPDQTRFKGAKLVYQEPLENSDTFVRRIYATDRLDQDAYNYAVKYSAGSPDHPIYIRTYVVPRADYFPLPEGTADPFLENAFLIEEEMAPVEGELNSLYVRVTRVYETLPGPVLTSFETNEAGQKVTIITQRKPSTGYNLPAASATSSPSAQTENTGVVIEQIRSVPAVFGRASFSQERPDAIPAQFRDQIPTTTTEIIEAGQASAVSLTGDEIAKTQEQLTDHTRRTRVVTRSDSLTTNSLTGRAFNTEWGVPELVVDSIVDPATQPDSSGLVLEDQITPLNSTRSRRVRRELQAYPANYIYYEVAEDQVVLKNEVSLHRRDVTDPADPTFLPVPVVTGAIADISDTPLEFPWIRRVTKRLPTNQLGELILPNARTEYDTITYTFPGIIYTWKARYTGDQVRANLSFFDNRYPVSMTVAARNEVTYHVSTTLNPDDDPALNLSNPAARNGDEFFRVITRPWARIFFSIPDNTIHPPAPITIAKESVERGGIAFDIQGGQSSEPSAYTPGDEILVGGEVKRYWGNIYIKRLVYVSEPV